MQRHRPIALAVVIPVVFIASIAACPDRKYSPSNFGWCSYYYQAGPYSCDEYVADPWTGRTDCNTCGYCNWSNPTTNVPCSVGDDPHGPRHIASGLEENRCGSAHRDSFRSSSVVADHNLSWVGARVDQVAIF